MKKLFKRPSKMNVTLGVIVLAVLASAGYSAWQTWLIRDDLGQLFTKVYEDTENYDTSQYSKAPDSKVTYKIIKQYTETLDVADPDSYSYSGGVEYIPTEVKVVEVEVTNNEEWVYSVYNSVGTVDENGKLTRSISGLRSSQDKNNSANGYGLELIPGGKGTMYLYFEDDGTEIARLYNVDASQEIILN